MIMYLYVYLQSNSLMIKAIKVNNDDTITKIRNVNPRQQAVNNTCAMSCTCTCACRTMKKRICFVQTVFLLGQPYKFSVMQTNTTL